MNLMTKVDPATTALVVVDIQNEFCADDGWYGTQGVDLGMMQEAAKHTVALLHEARKAGVRVVFVQATYDDHYINEPMRQLIREFGGDDLVGKICATGTYGADFYLVVPEPDEPIVTKHRYSAFYGTELEVILDAWEIRTVVLAGVMTNVCIDAAARDANYRGFHVVVVDDCTGTCTAGRDDITPAELHRHTLATIEMALGTVVSSDEVARAWRAVPASGTQAVKSS
jgi:ureidoacrylate peracid hydrolase